MWKNNIMNFGIKILKKNLTSQDFEFKPDSKSIRERYHRIRKSSYNEFQSGKVSLEKPIFMLGVPHSGTSVLAETFRLHPDIAMWTEAPEVWEPYWSEVVDNEYNRLVPRYAKDVETMDVLRIKDAFGRYVKSQNKTRLLNKNPRNTVRVEFLRKIFPDAKIIHIFRDGRDVVNSLTRNVPDRMIEEICELWTNSIREFKNQSKNIPSPDLYEIKYEEFCERPNEILIEAYDKCELSINDVITGRLPTKLHNFNGKWKNEINENYHEVMRKKIEPMMIELGYVW